MNIMVGDSRLENVAVRSSDVKVREAYIAENQQVQEILDEQAKEMAGDGVVLELNKSEQNAEQIKAEALDKVQNNTKDQEQAEKLAVENEKKKMANIQHVLENIDIYPR
ncbi:MAG: hypothetical protein HFJ09_11705 [Lachnospiraceae bacterium]|nr:hypothetical protein [Lachnospiraceae bacterium]